MNYSCDVLNGKRVYAFGDSIVYGHNAPKQSFMQLLSNDYGMDLNMLAKNGATVVTINSCLKEDPTEETKDNYIINQIKGAPSEKPDVIIFDGYTNDAYGDSAADSFNLNGAHINIWENLGTIQGKNAIEFDTSTFCGGFERIICEMRKKWGDTPIVFITIHKSGGRDWDTQCKLRDLSLEICKEWGVDVADIFENTALDTRNADQMKKYIINGAGSHPNASACRKFYIPVAAKKLDEVLSRCVYTQPDNINDTAGFAVFAGQANMFGSQTEKYSLSNIVYTSDFVNYGQEAIQKAVDACAEMGGVKNVYFHDCKISGTMQGIRIKSMRGRGGYVDNVKFHNIEINDVEDEAIQINMFYEFSTVMPKSNTPSDCRNIEIRNVTGKGAKTGVQIKGLPERRLNNIKLENISLAAQNAFICSDAENIEMNNVIIRDMKIEEN